MLEHFSVIAVIIIFYFDLLSIFITDFLTFTVFPVHPSGKGQAILFDANNRLSFLNSTRQNSSDFEALALVT